ncbi:MAG: hypothetical protein IJE00_00415 [Clostridia bacterium]|nr:hypothetical protein [Clostridia bacterium]
MTDISSVFEWLNSPEGSRYALIAVAVLVVLIVIVRIVRAAKKRTPTETPTVTTNYTPSYSSSPSSSSSGGTAKIFVNGGSPFSGDKMGKIAVDGRSMNVYYSDLPLEITIPAGRRHVVVEGGLYGDARIDRYIDFDVLDVWTVDLPGSGDADVIRHQMIGYSEYRSALSSAGFSPTRRSL